MLDRLIFHRHFETLPENQGFLEWRAYEMFSPSHQTVRRTTLQVGSSEVRVGVSTSSRGSVLECDFVPSSIIDHSIDCADDLELAVHLVEETLSDPFGSKTSLDLMDSFITYIEIAIDTTLPFDYSLLYEIASTLRPRWKYSRFCSESSIYWGNAKSTQIKIYDKSVELQRKSGIVPTCPLARLEITLANRKAISRFMWGAEGEKRVLHLSRLCGMNGFSRLKRRTLRYLDRELFSGVSFPETPNLTYDSLRRHFRSDSDLSWFALYHLLKTNNGVREYLSNCPPKTRSRRRKEFERFSRIYRSIQDETGLSLQQAFDTWTGLIRSKLDVSESEIPSLAVQPFTPTDGGKNHDRN